MIVGVDAAAWMALTWVGREQRDPAASGIARRRRSRFLVLGVLVVSVTLAFGGVGTRIAQHIPLWVLVAIQSFRLPLELAMHALFERGIMPVQMSYSGRNFDIVTGATAIVVAVARQSGAWRTPAGRRRGTCSGSRCSSTSSSVAIASTPRIRYFGDDRVVTFVTYPPFVWLPAVMVVAALAGHLVIFRALRRL